MYERSDLRSQSLDLLRFPLAVVIVIIHVFDERGFIIHGNYVDPMNYSSFVVVKHCIDGFFSSQSVPIYFFISGFVFFVGIELTKEKYIQKLKNRVKTLLIPYLIWNTIAIILLATRLLPCFSRYLSYESSIHFSWSGLLSCYWIDDKSLVPSLPPPTDTSLPLERGPVDGPLWFVRDLMIVVLFAPLIYWLLKRTKGYVVLLLGIIWFTLGYWQLGHINRLSSAFFFFSFGAYMSINRKDMLVEFGRYFNLSMIGYPLLAILYIISAYYFPEWSFTIKRLNILIGLLFAYNLAAWLLKKKWCKEHPFLVQASFFIYVSHVLICGRITKILYTLTTPASGISFVCLYVGTAVITILLLLGVFYLMRKYCPAVLKVIAGRK